MGGATSERKCGVATRVFTAGSCHAQDKKTMVQIARMLKEGISILGEQPTNMVRQQVINI
jgi:hypothetical protein